MNRKVLKYTIASLLILTSISGCSSVDEVSSIEDIVKEDVKVDEDSNVSKIETYRSLVSNKNKVKGLFGEVKLKEPLVLEPGIIPETPPDDEFVDLDEEIQEEDKEDGEEGTEETVKEERVLIDRNNIETELPDKSEFIAKVVNYLNSEINSGCITVYSYDTNIVEENPLFGIDYTIRQLKISFESIEYKNDTIKELFKDDEELMKSWESCYEQLVKDRDIVYSITDSSDVMEHNKEIDVEALYSCYSSFEQIANSRIVSN